MTSKAIYDDVPVMPGMIYVKEASTIYDTPGARACRLTYRNDRDVYLAAISYYKQQMGASKWQYVNTMGMGEATRMDFKKGSEACTVMVKAVDDKTTTVTVEIRGDKSTGNIGENKAK